jgi:hypothetical protein
MANLWLDMSCCPPPSGCHQLKGTDTAPYGRGFYCLLGVAHLTPDILNKKTPMKIINLKLIRTNDTSQS